jgi:hypothetical protein
VLDYTSANPTCTACLNQELRPQNKKNDDAGFLNGNQSANNRHSLYFHKGSDAAIGAVHKAFVHSHLTTPFVKVSDLDSRTAAYYTPPCCVFMGHKKR